VKLQVKAGTRGWLAMALVALAVDVLDETTLSESFRDYSRTPSGRVVTSAGWVVLTAHLFGLLPPEYDPFVLFFAHMPKRRKVVIVNV
jgi:hypothetical protein